MINKGLAYILLFSISSWTHAGLFKCLTSFFYPKKPVTKVASAPRKQEYSRAELAPKGQVRVQVRPDMVSPKRAADWNANIREDGYELTKGLPRPSALEEIDLFHTIKRTLTPNNSVEAFRMDDGSWVWIKISGDLEKLNPENGFPPQFTAFLESRFQFLLGKYGPPRPYTAGRDFQSVDGLNALMKFNIRTGLSGAPGFHTDFGNGIQLLDNINLTKPHGTLARGKEGNIFQVEPGETLEILTKSNIYGGPANDHAPPLTAGDRIFFRGDYVPQNP
jgi:hypothetical protein